MTVYSNVTELIGRTPLAKLSRITGGSTTVIAKLEFYNPANSVRDCIGATITEAAEASGELRPGGTIVKGTSGSTSIALAMVGAAKGYKVVLAMPETISLEHRVLLRTYGTELVLIPGPLGMREAVAKAEEIVEERGGVLARQFASPANLAVHRHTTAGEIQADTDGKVSIFVAGVGTGGTVSGVGQVLREHKPEAKTAAVEPAESPIPSGDQPGPYKIQGLGANFTPEVPDRDVIDEVITRNVDRSIEFARTTATQGDLLVGVSSGAAFSATVGVVNRPENAGKTIVAVLPDFGERYLPTVLFKSLVDA